MVPCGWLLVVAMQAVEPEAELADPPTEDAADVEAPAAEVPRRRTRAEPERVPPGTLITRAVAEAAGGTAGATAATLVGLAGEAIVVSIPVAALSLLLSLFIVLILLAIISAFGAAPQDADTGPLILYLAAILYLALMLLVSPLLALTAPAWDLAGYVTGVVLASSMTRAGGLVSGLSGLVSTGGRIAAHVGVALAVAVPGLVLALLALVSSVGLMGIALNPDLRTQVPLVPAQNPDGPDPVIAASFALMLTGLGIGAIAALLVRPVVHGVAAFLLDAFAWPERAP
ncbi:MAG: hypothetical protein HY904_12550 [Deltaproteobacteria bacterium]|nr:hypothetical protein [Deltaproteobacteria bacterium]